MIVSDEFEYGILLSTMTGVSIPTDQDTPFWSLDDADKIKALDNARVKCRFLIQYEDFLFTQRASSNTLLLDDSGKLMDALLGMPSNPFASDDEKALAELIVSDFESYRQSQITKRHPSKSLRQNVISRDKSACRYCGKPLEDRDGQLHIDHVIPYSVGGLASMDNLVVSCRSCNLRKAGRTLDESGLTLIRIESLCQKQS